MKSYRYRLYPTKLQEKKLLRWLDLCRWLYNCALEERIIYYKKYRELRKHNKQSSLLPELKELLSEFKEIHAQVLQNVLSRLDKTYSNLFRSIKEEKLSFPRFQCKNRYNSFTYPQYVKHSNQFKIQP